MRALAFAVRTSPAAVPVLAGLAVGAAQAFTDGWSSGQWDDSLSTAVNHGLYVEFAVAAGTAYAADRARRSWPTLASGCRGMSAPAVAILGASVWGCLAILVLCAMALAGTAAVSPFRMPNLLLVAVGLAWTVSSAGCGWLVGSVLRWYYGVPLVLLGTWLGNALAAVRIGEWPALLSGIEDGGFPAGVAPSTPVLFAQVLVFAAVAGLVTIASGWRRSSARHRVRAAVLLATCLAIAASTLRVTGPHREIVLTHAAGPRTCGHRPIPTCSWPDDDGSRLIAARVGSVLWRPLAREGRVPAGIAETGLAHPGSWIDLRMWSREEADLAYAIARATVAWFWCPAPDDEVGDQGSAALDDRATLLAQPILDYPAGLLGHEAQRIQARPAREQALWLRTRPPGVPCVRS